MKSHLDDLDADVIADNVNMAENYILALRSRLAAAEQQRDNLFKANQEMADRLFGSADGPPPVGNEESKHRHDIITRLQGRVDGLERALRIVSTVEMEFEHE